MAGMLAARFPGPGLLACALLALLALPATADARALKAALFAAFFGLGFLFAPFAASAPPEDAAVPEWVRAAAVPGDSTDPRYTQGLPLAGTVAANEPLAGGRSRLELRDVRTPGEDAPLPGELVLSWQTPPPEIALAGPGQRLALTLRLREIRGFANPGVWETERYWRDRGAYFRAWTKEDGTRNGKDAPYALLGEASLFWRARSALRRAVSAALAGGDGTGQRENAGEVRPLSQSAAIIPALLFGDRSHLLPETMERVAKSTLAHSLALSGMHLGFAAGIGYGAASLLGFLFPSLFLYLPRQKAGLLCAAPLCLCYLWLGGAPPSLVRAALMLLFWAALLWMNRPKVLVDGLLWAAAVILLVSPASLFDIRLQLSVASVAGIGLASPLLDALALWSRPERGDARGGLRCLLLPVLGMAVVSVAAQAATLPLVLDAFPGTGLCFPLNLVWLPVLGIWVMPLAFAGLFSAGIGLPAAASLFFSLAGIPCSWLLSLLGAMDGAGLLAAPVSLRPAYPAAAGFWLLLLLLPAVLRARALTRRTFFLVCLGLALAVAPTLASRPPAFLAGARDGVRLTLLDVGQGQSIVVSWQSGGRRGRMLVDGGGFASSFFDTGREIVAPALTDNEAPRLDWIVNTHTDADHLKGLLFPLETFMVGQTASGPDAAREDTGTTRQRDAILARRGITPAIWRAGDTIALAPDLSVQVLSPEENGPSLSPNDRALVLRLSWRGKPLALLCGDLERKGVNLLLRRKVPLEAEALVLPHHGSAGSFVPGLYDAVSPAIALVSSGYGNPWRFPSEKVREALARRSIPLASTAGKGRITVAWDENGVMTTSFARREGPGSP